MKNNRSKALYQQPTIDTQLYQLVDKIAVAKSQDVCTRTVELQMKEGMPFYRLGRRCVRFNLNEVHAWLASRYTVAKSESQQSTK